MQGVLTKRHILAHPWTVIRHFGVSMFVAVLRAPEQATFLEILARYEFNKEQKETLRLARRLETSADSLQRQVLARAVFDEVAAYQLDHVAELLAQLTKSRSYDARGVDPLMNRFTVLLQSLAAKDGPVKAALGTLSPTELVAVEARVLRTTQKRCRDEIEQRLNQARTELDVVRAHLQRLFQKLEPAARDDWAKKLKPQALQLVR